RLSAGDRAARPDRRALQRHRRRDRRERRARRGDPDPAASDLMPPLDPSVPPLEPPAPPKRTRQRSLVLVNTGDGKGESTAAFGVVMRAVARAWRGIALP